MKTLSEIPKQRNSDKLISEIELNDAENFVLSGTGSGEKNGPGKIKIEDLPDTPKLEYTGTGEANETKIENVKRSTMLGVNLFGRKSNVDHLKPSPKGKKVNFAVDDFETGGGNTKAQPSKKFYTGSY